jgi:hypothetical protein
MAQDVLIRLAEHNRGKSKYTKAHMPYELLYQEGCQDILEALKRGEYLMSITSKNCGTLDIFMSENACRPLQMQRKLLIYCLKDRTNADLPEKKMPSNST